MTGKILVSLLAVCSVLGGAGMYYLQVYHYYIEVPGNGVDDVQLTLLDSGALQTLPYSDFQAIDAESSPIRYRACFKTSETLDDVDKAYEPYTGAAPRTAPGWFDCFDAEAIGTLIETDKAQVYVGQRNLEFGIDRVVAVTSDGRGYVWHEINECGDKAYDGSPLGKDCPIREGN